MVNIIKVDKGTKVTHCHGTSERSPECRVCGSWINHWEKYVNERIDIDTLLTTDIFHVADKCCICGQEDKFYLGDEIVGAHVRIDGHNGEWIIPICKRCNSSGKSKEDDVKTVQYSVFAVSAIQCNYNDLIF